MVLGLGGLDDSLRKKCACHPPDASDPPDYYSNRPYTLPWDSNWTVEEIQDEEIRRLCWSALSLVSEYVAQCEAFNEESPRFFLCNPSNVNPYSSFLNPWLMIIAHHSSGSSSLEKCSIVVHQVIAQLIPFHQKNPFGLSTVGACSFGIFVTASVNQVKRKRELSRLMKLFLKPKLLKTPWTHIDATSTPP